MHVCNLPRIDTHPSLKDQPHDHLPAAAVVVMVMDLLVWPMLVVVAVLVWVIGVDED